MMVEQGWAGTGMQLMHVLGTYGVDTDDEGNFIVRGGITSFMGMGKDFVVAGDAQARINGEWASVVGMLKTTSYGTAVTVI